MKLEIDIPEWAEKKNLFVFAGMEMLAFRYVGQKIHLKTSRCDKCGDCCRNIKGDFPPQTDGVCDFLKDTVCSLGTSRPFSCGFPNTRFECAEKYDD